MKQGRETDLIGGVETGQNGVGGFKVAADAPGVNGRGGDSHHMAHSAAD